MTPSRIQIYSILLVALVIFLLLPRLTMEFLNGAMNRTHIVSREEAQAECVKALPVAQNQSQLSPAELQASYLKQKLINKANETRILAENAARLKQVIKETEKSFAEVKQRKDVDPISFVKEASQRASLYLAAGDKRSAYNLYKEAVSALKDTTPMVDTYEFEDPLWRFLTEYLKTAKSKAEEQDAIERLLKASDRKGSIPYLNGSLQVENYFASIGRKQDALNFLLKVIALELKNRPEDVDSLTASSTELERLCVEIKQQDKAEKAFRDILAATEKNHRNESASVIVPLANLSAFCIKNNQLNEGDGLAARALDIAGRETNTCLLDHLAPIADSYTATNSLDKCESFLNKVSDIKSNHFKSVELSYLTNSYRELKTKFEERNQWNRAESLLERFKLAQEPGKYSEMCMLQDLYYGNLEEAAKLQNQNKTAEAQNALKKADDAYLKVKQYFLKEPQQSAVQDWIKTRQNRLKALGLQDNLPNQ